MDYIDKAEKYYKITDDKRGNLFKNICTILENYNRAILKDIDEIELDIYIILSKIMIIL